MMETVPCRICGTVVMMGFLHEHMYYVHNLGKKIGKKTISSFVEKPKFIPQQPVVKNKQQILKNQTPEKSTKEETCIQPLNQPKKSSWREEKCQRCSTPIYIHKDWIKPLFFCKECTAYRKKARKITSISDKKIKKLGFRLIFTPFETNRRRH